MLYPLIHVAPTLYFHVAPVWLCALFLLGMAWRHVGGLVWMDTLMWLGVAQPASFVVRKGTRLDVWQGIVQRRVQVRLNLPY